MSDEPKKRTCAWVLWALITVLVVVYPLSLGPAISLGRVSNTGIAGEQSVYAPIWWMYRHSPAVRTVVDRYARWFSR
jgi:hypothetical protein